MKERQSKCRKCGNMGLVYQYGTCKECLGRTFQRLKPILEDFDRRRVGL